MALIAIQKTNRFRWKCARAYSSCRKAQKPFGMPSKSDPFMKKQRHKKERQRIRLNVEAPTMYKRYAGYDI